MKDKFIVKIPIDKENEQHEQHEYKEVRFKTRAEITEFLQISMNTLSTIINHEFKCTLSKYKHLKGIIVERIVDNECVNPVVELDPIEFRKKLIEKIV